MKALLLAVENVDVVVAVVVVLIDVWVLTSDGRFGQDG